MREKHYLRGLPGCWEIQVESSGEMRLKLPSFKTKGASEMAVTGDGKYLAHISGSALIIVDVSTGKEIVRFKDLKNPSHIAISRNGDLIAVKNTQGVIAVYNLRNLNLEKIINLNNGEGCNLLFSPDNQYLIDADWQGHIMLIDFKSGMGKILKYYDKCMIEGIDYNSNTNKFVFLAGPKASEESGKIENENMLFEWEYPFKKEPTLKTIPTATLCIAKYSPDGKFIAYSNNWHHKVRVYDLQLNNVMCEVEADSITDMAWGDGKLGIVDQSLVRIYNFPSLKILKEFELDYACFIDFVGDFTLVGSWNKGFYLSCDDLMDFSAK